MKGKRKYGPHLLQTEATFDEAVEIFAKTIAGKKQSLARKGNKATTKQLFALGRGNLRDVTLSDRKHINPHRVVAAPKAKPVIWSKQQVIEAYASGHFKPHELSLRARVPVVQIKYWIYGKDYFPESWTCCKSLTYKQSHCPICGLHWKVRYNVK